jgi:7,8-dihydroneopterin aldolase/epimerase/oxygenase
MSIAIHLHGLELHGRHGVLEEERRLGQRFLVDLELVYRDDEAGRAAASDRIEHAADYRDVVALVAEVSDGHAYHLLEALASAMADALLERFPFARVVVRVRKPDVPLALAAEHAAVVVQRVSEREG